MATYLRIFVALCCCVVYTSAKKCTTKDVIGQLITCSYNNDEIEVNPNGTSVPMETECLVAERQEVTILRCTGPSWTVFHEQSTKGVSRDRIIARRKKRGWFSGVLKVFKCVATFLTSCGRHGPPPDRTAPVFTYCPEMATGTADPLQTWGKVSWTEPRAHDDVDGTIRPVLIDGRLPGRHFPGNKETTIRYMAKDRSGNVNYCPFLVHLKVIRCPAPEPVQNGYYSCTPTTEFILGGFCRFGCYDGFELKGPSHVKCQENGTWTDQEHPTCIPFKCPSLPSVEGAGAASCNNDRYFRSICTYNCVLGYDMPPQVSKALVCTSQKTWRQHGQPRCIDVESPRFKQCPSIKIFGTDTGVNTSTVEWTVPDVEDNSRQLVTASLRQGSRVPGDKLSAGTYTIEYIAEDKQGNRAPPCKFNVIVRDVRCPRLYPTPHQSIHCPRGYRSGSMCDVSCNGGKALSSSSRDVQCRRRTAGDMFGYWDWSGGQQAMCLNTNKCEPISAPTNGAVVCDNWLEGKYCQLQCRNGTRMAGTNTKTLFVCDAEANWMPQPQVVPCKVERHPRAHVGMDAIFYFGGECTKESAKEDIANNFIRCIATSGFSAEVCPQVGQNECGPQNVQITCGESSRHRRETDDENANHSILKLSFQLPLMVPLSETNYAESQHIIHRMSTQMHDIIANNIEEVFGNKSRLGSVTNTGITTVCPVGSVKSETGVTCLDCPEGTYFDQNNNECELCAKGFYQDTAGLLSCKRCPDGTTTRRQGAPSVQDCEDACLPGSYSDDGAIPCSPCAIGTFQTSFSQTECHKCRGSKTTLLDGVSSSSDCQEFDILLTHNNEPSFASVSFPTKYVQDFTVTFWVYVNLPTSTYPNVEFYDVNNVKVWTFESLQNVTHSGYTTTVDAPITDNRWHHVTVQSRRCAATVYIDGMLLPDIEFKGNCSLLEISNVTLVTDGDFEGGFSQFNVWESATAPVSYSRCSSTKTGDIVKWQDFDGSQLSGGYLQIPSQCDDFNNCISGPCENNATCTDTLQGYQCACLSGFTGNQCELNIDDCETNICMHGAVCVDGVGSYTCKCPPDFTGIFCETKFVDGKWSDWGNWSECTTPCGDGEQSRQRLCNNPTPDNGGKDCQGSKVETRECNNTACPVCPQFEVPSNGRISCDNTTDFITCTIDCGDGYDFDIEPLPLYFCGRNTSYEWNIQNDINPLGHIPNCVAIDLPEKVSVHYSAQYMDLICMNQVMGQEAHEMIRKRVITVLNELACIKTGTCSLEDFQISNCDGSQRERRQIQTAGFTLTISTQPIDHGETADLTELQDAFEQIQTSAANGEFTAEILDDEYELVSNSTNVSGDIQCGPGMTRVQFYCIPCGPGTYKYGDYCRPCDVGLYQESPGSSHCISCPQGTSTVGILSRSADDCTVKMVDNVEPLKVTAIVLGCCSALLVVAIAIFAYRRYRSVKDKSVVPVDINLKRINVSSQSARSTQNDASFYIHGFQVGIDGVVKHWKPWR